MDQSTTTPIHSHRRDVAISLALFAILLVGGALRFYNVNWDKGTYHVHPDERNTTMVLGRLQWPGKIDQYLDCRYALTSDCTQVQIEWQNVLKEYFDTSHSTLNPRNVGGVYFYGTFPLYLTKFVATVGDVLQLEQAQAAPDPATYLADHARLTDYNQIHLVGRVLSGLFDLGTVLLLFFLARRLFDWRVGLLASFLLAFAVLNVQGSHYFTVDTFLTFFVTLTLWFTLDVAEGKGWPSYLALGASMGLTLSCKVSVFLLAAVVGLGAWLGLRHRLRRGHEAFPASSRVLLGLAAAVVVAVGVFRVAQPYAWAGPNYDGWDSVPDPWGERLKIFQKVPEPIRAVLMPNPQWIGDIVEAGAQQTGEADLPWGRQWTERTPWLWPLQNMVVWTLGVPFGVAAWLGVGLVLLQFGRRWLHRRRFGTPGSGFKIRALVLLPLAWVLLSFFWQGMQYVKSVRYFMPIHPFLALFAGYLVIRAWDWARVRRRGARLAAGGLAAVVLVGTLAWAFAFTQIYTEPITRVQATRWMYENIPSGATLHYRTLDGGTGQLQIPLPSTEVYPADGEWRTTTFTPPEDVVATDVVMNNLAGVDGPGEGTFEIQIAADWADPPLVTRAEIEDTFGGSGGKQHLVDLPDALLTSGQTYYFQSRVVRGAPLISYGSVLANELFDDPLPFSMDGHIAFGAGPYRSLELYYPDSANPIDQLPLYDEDTPDKLEMLLDALDQADYIVMSSGRLWQSIPRLPMRYPMTTRYYELLFAGKLGFEKAAEFHSYPRLFGIEFDDTWAEEQFTVYDHPKVLIYHKTAAYDREQVRAMLSDGIDWDSIPHWLNPRDVPKWKREQGQLAREQSQSLSIQAAKNDLKLTPAQQQVQEQGGTWASIFNRNSLVNHWPTLSWLVLVGVVGLTALPLTVGILGRLPDRGYILARPIGVLLLAWLSWILTNLTPLHYTRGTILLALGLVATISLLSLLLPAQRRRLLDLWRTRKRLILVNEGLFLAFFALFWFIRWGNPDLWHPWMGGEKPMDLAYLNAVIKSTEFPPYDPWFAGGYLNYYYFGQVMVGTLIKLIGIVPNVAYNLAIPLWFAMTAMGAFSVTYNLVAKRTDDHGQSGKLLKPLVFGLLGALFVAVLGNLGEIHLLLLKLGEGVMDTFQSTIPGLAALVRIVIGSFETVFGGRALPISINEWYWNASRAIPAPPSESVITEFPFFTFLYADLHAHLIAMPLTFLSLAVALSFVKGAENPARSPSVPRRRFLGTLAPLLLWALTIGAMRTTNTWDVPPHLLIALGALVIAANERRQPGWSGFLRLGWSVLWKMALLFVLGWWLLYQPFWASYGSYYNSIAVWTGTRTAFWAYLVVYGLFLFAIVSYLAARTFGRGQGQSPEPLLRRVYLTLRYRHRSSRLRDAARMAGVRRLPLGALAWAALILLVLVELFFLIPGIIPFTRANADALESGVYAYRGLSVFALGLPVTLLGLLLLFRRRVSPTERLWVYLVLLGVGMTMGVEVIVLQGDIARMNTVFKFYLQTWLIWGVAAAAALAWLFPRLQRWHVGRKVWLGTLGVLLLCAALYPLLATPAKIGDRFADVTGPGLDGWAYMETATYYDPQPGSQPYELKWDLEAIRWLLDNVVGSPVILEGQTTEYRWGSRYSINTGLPTVVGWNWHQRQQRAAANDQEVWDRVSDVATIYNTPLTDRAAALLQKYDVRYVIVGPLERTYYDPAGLKKFEWMVAEGMLRIVYSNQQVTIYEVIG
jgi:YYY domain-containing protein